MAKYVLAKKHYTNEAAVVAAVLKDAHENHIHVNPNTLRKFLEEDAFLAASNPNGTGTYNPNGAGTLNYAFFASDNKVFMIAKGNRTVLPARSGGTQADYAYRPRSGGAILRPLSAWRRFTSLNQVKTLSGRTKSLDYQREVLLVRVFFIFRPVPEKHQLN